MVWTQPVGLWYTQWGIYMVSPMWMLLAALETRVFRTDYHEQTWILFGASQALFWLHLALRTFKSRSAQNFTRCGVFTMQMIHDVAVFLLIYDAMYHLSELEGPGSVSPASFEDAQHIKVWIARCHIFCGFFGLACFTFPGVTVAPPKFEWHPVRLFPPLYRPSEKPRVVKGLLCHISLEWVDLAVMTSALIASDDELQSGTFLGFEFTFILKAFIWVKVAWAICIHLVLCHFFSDSHESNHKRILKICTITEFLSDAPELIVIFASGMYEQSDFLVICALFNFALTVKGILYIPLANGLFKFLQRCCFMEPGQEEPDSLESACARHCSSCVSYASVEWCLGRCIKMSTSAILWCYQCCLQASQVDEERNEKKETNASSDSEHSAPGGQGAEKQNYIKEPANLQEGQCDDKIISRGLGEEPASKLLKSILITCDHLYPSHADKRDHPFLDDLDKILAENSGSGCDSGAYHLLTSLEKESSVSTGPWSIRLSKKEAIDPPIFDTKLAETIVAAIKKIMEPIITARNDELRKTPTVKQATYTFDRQQTMGITCRADGQVEAVTEGSLAANYGIKKGNRVLKINGANWIMSGDTAWVDQILLQGDDIKTYKVTFEVLRYQKVIIREDLRGRVFEPDGLSPEVTPRTLELLQGKSSEARNEVDNAVLRESQTAL